MSVASYLTAASSAALQRFEPQREKTYLQTCAPNEDSDQPAHPRSLIKIFTGRVLDSQGCEVSWCGQWRLRSDCATAQVDLSVHWAHMSEVPFSDVAAHLSNSCLFVVPEGLSPKVNLNVRTCRKHLRFVKRPPTRVHFLGDILSPNFIRKSKYFISTSKTLFAEDKRAIVIWWCFIVRRQNRRQFNRDKWRSCGEQLYRLATRRK